ncbi:MAG: ABC transporter related protein [Candidatus Moranbacteria bacterium GW2011_GWE1_36_7]|nr:MAG: ABC transporter related protein [Candidatus Moranbacteria bacterium GW2011_GWD2_36_12]KKQ06991.1 MAG: ABC transporter related protein [Candidatus Moranbacteria bacterium GW2011_GWE2_36_40]KKQ15619.1 MAG: ABC transporter related protein [Candidatus Moranbacteria bacterium GW2011_GWE1_36_7]
MTEEKKEIVIKVAGVKKNFIVGEQSIPVLMGIDLEIFRGEFVLLVGPSGCGKSTLLHTIYGLEEPTVGTVFIDDDDIWVKTKDWRANFRNQNIGFIPQQPFWIKSLTVIENIAIPAIITGKTFAEGIEIGAKLIELVGMSEWANHRPYDLSGGQQQRIALARSLLLDPKFIIADEPTGNLDRAAGEKLMQLLLDISEQFNITILMVTHNTDQYKFGTRIVNMVDGKIMSDVVNKGSLTEIKKDKN